MHRDLEMVQAAARIPGTPFNATEGSPQMVVCAVLQAP